MAFALKPGKSIRRQLIRLARKELGRASRRLLADQNAEAVHEARKSVKKAETIVSVIDRLGGDLPKHDARRLKQARRGLSVLRDSDVLVDTFDALRSRSRTRISEHTAALIRRHLHHARSTTETRARRVGRLPHIAMALRKVRRSARGWRLPSVDGRTLSRMIAKAYGDSRRAMRRARDRGRMDDFHAWRKQVKGLWYLLRLAEPLVPGSSAAIKRFKRLEATLGEEHNVAVLGERFSRETPLGRLGSKAAGARSAAAARAKALRRDALAQGARLLAEPARRFRAALRRRMKTAPVKQSPAPSRRSRAA